MNEEGASYLNFAPFFVADGSLISLLEETASFETNFKWCISFSEMPSARRHTVNFCMETKFCIHILNRMKLQIQYRWIECNNRAWDSIKLTKTKKKKKKIPTALGKKINMLPNFIFKKYQKGLHPLWKL